MHPYFEPGGGLPDETLPGQEQAHGWAEACQRHAEVRWGWEPFILPDEALTGQEQAYGWAEARQRHA